MSVVQPNDLQSRVAAVVQEAIDQGDECGVQVVVVHGHEPVVDLAQGWCESSRQRPIQSDSLISSWSTTKGFLITAIHVLAERGQLDYDDPVRKFWPAFADSGKSAITIRHLLTHRAGLPQMPPSVTPERLPDWQYFCDFFATARPCWRPGSATGYHFWSFGWLLGEVVRRIDGRDIARWLGEEICQPLGIADFHLGVPKEQFGRMTTLEQTPAAAVALREQSDMARQTIPRAITSAAVMNRPAVRQAVIPGAGGIMNARSLATLYAMLVNGGSWNGVSLLSPQRIRLATQLQTDAEDLVLGRRARVGLGYLLGGDPASGGEVRMGASGDEFGHKAYGGAIGYADPSRQLAIAITKNRMQLAQPTRETLAYRVGELVRDAVDSGAV